MHEIGLVDDIISVINERLRQVKNGSGVKKINIIIGELEHLTPEHFKFHFMERAKGTCLENAELSFKSVSAKFKCKDCGVFFTADEGLNGCPGCGSKSSDIVEGEGVFVESVEII